jgi:pimeloyl-ACP methyl ester carboxylesterase
MLVHGVHPEGIDEPRLREFARVLASSGVQVWTPEIDSLARYRIAPQAIDAIGKAAESAAEALDQRAVGVMGISFSGGLALMAAAREAHAPSMAFVVAVGAHHDLRRVARWYAGRTIEGPEGRAPPVEPHPYGAGVIIHNQLGAFFPERDLELARKALERALAGNRSAAREYLPRLSPSGRRQLRRILNRRGDGALAATLLEVIDEHSGQLASVSPAGSLGGLRVPVFLVHGTGDPVVPSVETRWLARAVPDAHLEQAVVTPFLRHAEQQRKPTWRQRLRLVHFMAEVIEAARDTD